MKVIENDRISAPLIFLLFIMFVSVSLAQSKGNIKGRIFDAGSGDGLQSVNVALLGTVLGASTDAEGRFMIQDVPEGTYKLTITTIGYELIEESVSITGGETIELEFRLTSRLIDIGEILVEEERVYSAASSRSVRKFDLQTRPNRSAQEMLQMAPGLVIAQHAGGGKAEQIFLRNFDADHGTDVAVSVDGLPVNMVSHGHGQGYADLHFLIPDVVEGIEVNKGPYFAEHGNLATAGAVSFQTKDHIDENLVRIEGGEFATSRITMLAQIPIPAAGAGHGSEHQGAYLAGQFYQTDGPVESQQGFQRFNLFGKFHTHISENSRLAFSAGAFSSAWDASGQIPARAVEKGMISRFGAIDDLEGGTTARQNMNLQYTVHGANNSRFAIQSYLSNYDFKLFSNFTFFLDDSLDGDMIEQLDNRSIVGLNSRYEVPYQLGSTWAATLLGGGYRADDITVGLWQSPDRQRNKLLVDSDISERNFFLWIQQEFVFNPKFRIQAGLRGDYLTYNVQDRLDVADGNDDTGLPHASGYTQQSILNPKLNMVFSPTNTLDVFVNGGSGFHSNDARNAVISQRISELYEVGQRRGLREQEIEQSLLDRNFDPAQRGVETLPRALGAELGFRTRIGQRVNVSAAAWYLYLEREYVYVGDAGTTELSDPTRRRGIDLEARVRLLPWMWADADVNISAGEIQDAPEGENSIPLAPDFTSTGGFTFIHPSGVDGSLRYRHIGDRPANENNSVVAEGYTVLDLFLGYRWGKIKFLTTVENLFDAEWNEAQFDTESLLRGELESTSEIHFTPGNPRNIRLGISYHF